MKDIYTLSVLLSFILILGCSKDFLKKYDKRIIGTWRISDVDRIGFGGNADNLPFQGGTFTFNEGGSLTYVNPANVTFQGSWDINQHTTDNETYKSLVITAVDFINQKVITEYYENINFVGTNHFKTKIFSGLHTYVTHFRR